MEVKLPRDPPERVEKGLDEIKLEELEQRFPTIEIDGVKYILVTM